jgi:hypothetical protein
MSRREFITLLGAAAAWPLAALAQEAGRTYRVGALTGGPRGSPGGVAMFDELRRSGFVEGQNLTIDWRPYSPHIDRISEIAADLVKSKVDVIFATGDTGIRAAQRATTTIPILGTTDDMVESGLVESLARPGGNTTGTSFLSAELDGKRQEILIESVPGLRRIAAIADSNKTAGSRLQILKRRRTYATSNFRFTRSPNPRKSRQHRRGEDIGRGSAKRFGVTHPLRQSPDYYATRRGVAPPYHLSISGRGGGRRFYRLRPTCRPSVSRGNGPAARRTLARCQTCRYAGRAADQVRARDQRQDRESARADCPSVYAATRRRGDRIRMRSAAARMSPVGPQGTSRDARVK